MSFVRFRRQTAGVEKEKKLLDRVSDVMRIASARRKLSRGLFKTALQSSLHLPARADARGIRVNPGHLAAAFVFRKCALEPALTSGSFRSPPSDVITIA